MTVAASRQKNPDQLRQCLLRAAARLAVDKGLSGVTFNAVCAGAGVSKGGLQHHFATKAALIDALFTDMMARFSAEMDAEIAADNEPHGRITRAYIRTITRPLIAEEVELYSAALIALLSSPRLKQQWLAWVNEATAREYANNDPGALYIARLAADGLWLAQISGEHTCQEPDKQATVARLVALTQSSRSV